jgi:hypothetical protein
MGNKATTPDSYDKVTLFFTEPTQQCFDGISKHAYDMHDLSNTMNWWIYGVRQSFGDRLDTDGFPVLLPVISDSDVKSLMDMGAPTALQLDAMVALYSGSGDTKYINKLKQVACDHSQPFIIRSAAKWAHDSMVKQVREKLRRAEPLLSS